MNHLSVSRGFLTKRLQGVLKSGWERSPWSRFGTLTGAIALSWVSLITPMAIAQNIPDFSGRGRPGNRVSAASRGGCPTPDIRMMPLAPVGVNYGGRTIDAQPTFWVYIPYALDANSPVTFIITDEEDNDLYRSTFTTVAPAGIYGIEVPDSVELLEERYYDWHVWVYCDDPNQQNVPSFASGWVQRVAPPDTLDHAGVSEMSPVEQSQVYADHLLWYDALTPLGEVLQADKTSTLAHAALVNLFGLPSVQLDEYADQSVVPCCEISLDP